MKIRLLFWLAMTILPPWASAAQEVSQPPAPKLSFDPKMFKGLGISPQLLEQFNSAQDLPAGRYRLDVFLNEQLRFRKELELRADTSGRQWICIDNALLAELGVEPRVSPQETCADLVKLFPGATAELEGGRLQYQISMPQAYLSKAPRGEVARGDLDAGITALTLNYLGNYQLVQTEGRQSYTRQSAYLSLNAGMNLGQWQLRQQGALQHDQDRGLRYQNLRTYVQRPLVDWGSEMVVGQTFTSGRFLSALGFNGLTLRTDERMLPDSMRGFAPVVRGVAQTNARVTVRQNGFQIYQTTVAPGSFEISDLYATSLSGDLDVEVLENDGRVRLFTVPFSAVPESLREGAGRYDIALGRTRAVGEGTDFFDAVYSRGLSNSWTATGGLRLAGVTGQPYWAAFSIRVWARLVVTSPMQVPRPMAFRR
ncbi:fimbrial biogenesis outer membrane usher protein [Diaphorobacter aerolatus]|uniref:Fimbrial biogenesis outer membrane usher protein n=1 Tax=Diaphorobacter aerolatus TaxID=1288495 RepID=A0A7H0GME9_9BURK|nr:fimbria/pilus outer membrane usher protein [Diaphorobacter aerolatus]QNP49465.1 fimbrial biogenesis outer membrane usher protein [Diaphorobacter aerolatus]